MFRCRALLVQVQHFARQRYQINNLTLSIFHQRHQSTKAAITKSLEANEKFQTTATPKSKSKSKFYPKRKRKSKTENLLNGEEQKINSSKNDKVKTIKVNAPKVSTVPKVKKVNAAKAKKAVVPKDIIPSRSQLVSDLAKALKTGSTDEKALDICRVLFNERLSSKKKERHRTVLELVMQRPILLKEYLTRYFTISHDLPVPQNSESTSTLQSVENRNVASFPLPVDFLQVLLDSTMSLYSFNPQEGVEALKNVRLVLEKGKKLITPSMLGKLFSETLFYSRDLDSAQEMLKEIRNFSSVIKVYNQESSLAEYFCKWAYLCTLDMLEMVLEVDQHKKIASNISLTHRRGNKYTVSIPSAFSMTRKGALIVRIQGSDMKSFYGTLMCAEDSNDRFLELKLPLGVKFDESSLYSIHNVSIISPYNGEIGALTKFANKGKSVVSDAVYSLLLDKELESPNSANPEAKLPPIIFDTLNDSQNKAIEQVLQNEVSLIQGPPGTGKTHTLAHLVHALVRTKGHRVLVVAPTNAGADNILEFCLKQGLNPVRMGDFEGTRPEMRQYLVQSMLTNSSGNHQDKFLETMRILRRANVVVSTCASSASTAIERVGIDCVIIDEASQLTEPLALVPITLGVKSVILVGDHQQLPPNVGYVASQEGYSDSLFDRLTKKMDPFLLDTQYRSHPFIMTISSNLFYNGELKHGVSPKNRLAPPGFPWPVDKDNNEIPVAFINTPFHESEMKTSKSKVNEREADVVVEIVELFIMAGMDPNDIGVISPYAGQNQYLERLLASRNIRITPASVDSFQGREKEVIVFSATRANDNGDLGFVSDHRRFNVMHTRAKRGLVIVGNRDTLERKGSYDFFWTKWLRWIDQHGLEGLLEFPESKKSYASKAPRNKH